jgi:hypothetical protein
VIGTETGTETGVPMPVICAGIEPDAEIGTETAAGAIVALDVV